MFFLMLLLNAVCARVCRGGREDSEGVLTTECKHFEFQV